MAGMMNAEPQFICANCGQPLDPAHFIGDGGAHSIQHFHIEGMGFLCFYLKSWRQKMTCDHSRKIGDNYGVTCQDCGAVLEGFGFWAEGGSRCVKHLWLQDGSDGFVCVYCEAWKPAREDGEVSDEQH
jgi:DNA-directed RNA polymerase subunit RPC12/RpoP